MLFLVVTSTNGKKLLTNIKRPAVDVLDIPQTPVDTCCSNVNKASKDVVAVV